MQIPPFKSVWQKTSRLLGDKAWSRSTPDGECFIGKQFISKRAVLSVIAFGEWGAGGGNISCSVNGAIPQQVFI